MRYANIITPADVMEEDVIDAVGGTLVAADIVQVSRFPNQRSRLITIQTNDSEEQLKAALEAEGVDCLAVETYEAY